VRELLECCGEVKSWSRQSDPETKQPKAFGFCEMEDADGVIRAVKLLNGRDLHGQALLVKTNQATQKYIDHYQAIQEMLKKAGKTAKETTVDADTAMPDAPEPGKEGTKEDGAPAGGGAESAGEGAAAGESEKSKPTDEEALVKMEELLKAPAAAMPPPPPAVAAQPESGKAEDGASAFLSTVLGGSSGKMSAEEKELERDLQRHVEEERVRERERRREEERIFFEREKQIERMERDREHDRKRLERKDQNLEKERQRQLEEDIAMDSDAEEPFHRRRIYAGSQRARERRKRREAELAEVRGLAPLPGCSPPRLFAAYCLLLQWRLL